MQLLHDKEERAAQIEFGKRVSRSDSSASHSHKNAHHSPKRKKLNLPSNAKKETHRKLTGHELELSTAVKNQHPVTLIFSSGEEVVEGKVQAFDKYAIKFKDDMTQTSMWIFKSNLNGIIINN